MRTTIPFKRLILVGAGHAHLHIAARSGSYLQQGIEPILVDPDSFWYSGMATGMLAGQYTPEQDQVIPQSLMQTRGGRFLHDRVTAIDAIEKRVTLSSGDQLSYDALSLNIGSKVHLSIPGIKEHTLPVKPIHKLWELRTQLEKEFVTAPEKSPRILVIGAGPAGCEVAACCASLARRRNRSVKIQLLTKGKGILTGESVKVSEKMRTILVSLGVKIETNCTAKQVENGVVVDTRGKYWHGEYIVCASGLAAPALQRESGLPVLKDNRLRILTTLQSITHPEIFACGDCAALEGYDLPQLGVFGVRQAPVLHQNLQGYLTNKPLKKYYPQKRGLKILNTGDGKALAIYGSFHAYGKISFLLKNFIDQRFMQKYRKLYS